METLFLFQKGLYYLEKLGYNRVISLGEVSKGLGKATKVAVIGCGTIANSAHIPSYMNNAEAVCGIGIVILQLK